MWALIIKGVLSFVGGPALAALIDGYKAKLSSENTSEKIAADLAAKDLDLAQRERELAAKQNDNDDGRWWTALPRAIVCYCFAVYVFHMIVWCGMWHLGTPFALTGDLKQWGGWLMALWFGGRSAEKVARILRS